MTAIYLFLLAGVVYYFGRPEPVPTAISSPTPQSTVVSVVYVSGSVARPGVYALGGVARASDAIEAAGGVLKEADLTSLNLAQRVYDEQHIHVPNKGEAGPVGELAGNPGQGGGKIDINHATAQELDQLPGTGPVLSQRIVDHRQENGPFAGTEDMVNVSGIGLATYERIKDLIVAR